LGWLFILCLLGAEAVMVTTTTSVMREAKKKGMFNLFSLLAPHRKKRAEMEKIMDESAQSKEDLKAAYWLGSKDVSRWQSKVVIVAQLFCVLVALAALIIQSSSKFGFFMSGICSVLITLTSLLLTRIDNDQLLNSASTILNLFFYPIAFISVLNSLHSGGRGSTDNDLSLIGSVLQAFAAVLASVLGAIGASMNFERKWRSSIRFIAIFIAGLAVAGVITSSILIVTQSLQNHVDDIDSQDISDVSLALGCVVGSFTGIYAIVAHEFLGEFKSMIICALMACGIWATSMLNRVLTLDVEAPRNTNVGLVLLTVSMFVMCVVLFVEGLEKDVPPSHSTLQEKVALREAKERDNEDES